MKRIVQQHLGVWVVAGVLLGGLGLSSAMPCNEASANSGPQQQVLTPGGGISLYQDPTGAYSTFRRSTSAGAFDSF